MGPKPVVLIILDGFGLASESPGNAISLAKTPFFERISVAYPHTSLLAAGESVGLPGGEAGNSEVGHLNIGAGMIVYQELPRINMAISDGSFLKNKALLRAVENVKKNKSNLHLMGLVGDGVVHSSLDHLFALLWLAKSQGLSNVYIHAFTDGRDSSPTSGVEVLKRIQDKAKEIGVGTLASVVGRYFAMDRDKRWERTSKAYDLLTSEVGARSDNIISTLEESYKRKITDEFIEPVLLPDPNGQTHPVVEKDSLIFFNFRPDRARQITHAFVDKEFSSFPRKRFLADLTLVSMTSYEKTLSVPIAFPPQSIDYPLASVLSLRDLRQLHIGETEKYAHVTYFINGGKEEAFPGEDRIHIPSSKVATYDQKPEMAAEEITNHVLSQIMAKLYDVYIVNFANADMVAHTGSIEATTKAIEFLDGCLEKIVTTVSAIGGVSVITADHGNAEMMIDPTTGRVNTEHTANPVPFIVVSEAFKNRQVLKLPSGILADVTPTVLSLLGIPKPESMTGKNLFNLL